MESRLSRYILFVTLVVAIGLAVNHYKGQWFTIPLLDEFFTALAPDSLQNNGDIEPLLESLEFQDEEHHEQTMSAEQRVACEALTVTQGRELKKQDNGIYTWVDDKGITHFSDAPAADTRSQLTQYKEPKYNFDIEINSIGTNPPPFLRSKLTTTIKQIDSVYRQFLPKRELLPIKVDLILAGNLTAYKKLEREYTNIVSASQGFYASRHNLAAVWHRSDAQAFSTALHESVHVMNAGQFGSTPRWFNEGLAEYFESPLYLRTLASKSQYELFSYDELKRARRAYRNAPLMPLSELLDADSKDWSGKKRGELYHASHHFIRFLMSSYQGRQTMKSLFNQFSDQRCQTKTPKQALAGYQGGMGKLSQDWMRWQRG